jgi:sugar phosphate permease
VIVGYGVGAVIVDMPIEYNLINMDWRKGFIIQAIALSVITSVFMTFDNNRLDVFGDRTIPDVPMNIDLRSVHSKLSVKTRKDVAKENFGDVLPLDKFAELIKNRVFFFTMCSLCATYFSSTALQFWCTNYIITVLKATPPQAHMIFGFSAITAPLIGAAYGGYLTDSMVSFSLLTLLGWLQRQALAYGLENRNVTLLHRHDLRCSNGFLL